MTDRSPNTPGGVVLLLLSVLASAVAQLMLRDAMSGGHGGFLAAVFTPAVVVGLAIYGSGTLLWLLCLTRLDLSFAYPVSAVQFVLVLGGAYWFLGESLSALRLAGVATIIAGVILLGFDRKEGESADD